MRFRHLDDDFVRAARQQSYLEQAKSQVGVGRLFRDREELLRIFGRYTQTDINSEEAILRLLRLTYEATKSPIREVVFPAGIDAGRVAAHDREHLGRRQVQGQAFSPLFVGDFHALPRFGWLTFD